MTVEILKSKEAVQLARAALRNRGLDCLDSALVSRLKRWGVLPGVEVGDAIKSWDILRSIEMIEQMVPKKAEILDVGAYACELLPALWRLGYRNLTGIDLNPRLVRMPKADTIRYVVKDFLASSFADASFDVITAISVIEHGFQRDRLLGEVARLLSPGGYFIASVDYWHDKIETAGVRAFGMDWTIFSREELAGLFEAAGSFGLVPCGSLDFSCQDKTVLWCGKEYTFAWLALQKC